MVSAIVIRGPAAAVATLCVLAYLESGQTAFLIAGAMFACLALLSFRGNSPAAVSFAATVLLLAHSGMAVFTGDIDVIGWRGSTYRVYEKVNPGVFWETVILCALGAAVFFVIGLYLMLRGKGPEK